MWDEKWTRVIYERMGDEESKMIYMARLAYSLTGEWKFIENMVDKTARSRPLWKEFLDVLKRKYADKDLVIFGAGIWGNILYKETSEIVSWKFVVDSDPLNKKVGDLKIVSFERFVDEYAGEEVVLSSYKNRGEMARQLKKSGIPDKNILDAGQVIYQLTEGAIYFDLPTPCLKGRREIFVDAGGFDGITTRQFLEWSRGNGYAYCFEPDERNILRAKKNLGSYRNYEIIPKALWSKSGRVTLNAKGNFATSVEEETMESAGQTIEAVALDDLYMDKGITFLKMDIEGAEVRALLGAQGIIESQSPRLAVSVYHKTEDIWEIPKLILEFCSTYDFYLRHYSFHGYDTVLYAIPKRYSL